MSRNNFFVEDGKIGTDESIGIDPVITLVASADMCVSMTCKSVDESGADIELGIAWELIKDSAVKILVLTYSHQYDDIKNCRGTNDF